MSQAFYAGTQAELAAGAANLVEIVTPAPATYGVPTATLTAYTTLTNNFISLLELATEPATRTTVSVENKNAAMKLLRSASVDIAKLITATQTVTNGMLLALQLNPRIIPQPRPVPMAPPAVDVKSVTGRIATLRVHDAQSENRRGKPFGATGAMIYTFVGENPPEDPTQYYCQGVATRTYVDVLFPNSVPSGATVWVSACWIGPRGQLGNGSAPRSFTLQGGPVTAQAA